VPDDEEAEVEPTSLVNESRFRPASRSDFDFDEDAMYPCAVRWGAEAFRLAKELILREPVRMARESGVALGVGSTCEVAAVITRPRASVPDSLTDGNPTRAASVAPTVDRSHVIPEMPPMALVVKTGFNCVIVVRIGGVPFRVVLDTGAARSLIRTSFAEQLRKSKKTRAQCTGRGR